MIDRVDWRLITKGWISLAIAQTITRGVGILFFSPSHTGEKSGDNTNEYEASVSYVQSRYVIHSIQLFIERSMSHLKPSIAPLHF